MFSRYPTRALLALIPTLVLWASAFAGIRAALRAYSPAQLALFRFLIASAALAIYAAFVHFRPPKLRDLPSLVAGGAIGVTFYNLALNYGEVHVSAGAASLLIASTPIWTALIAMVMLHERLTPLGWLGVVVSFAGVALIASGEGQGIHLSVEALAILAAAITSGVYLVQQKHFLDHYSALEFTAYTIWFGTLLMLPFGAGTLQAVAAAPLHSTLAVIYLGVFPGAFSYVAWAYVMSHGPAGQTSTFLYLEPVLAIAIAWIWLGELPNWISLTGGFIALAGVFLVTFRGHAQSVVSPMLSQPAD